jgi:hypothetical protein
VAMWLLGKVLLLDTCVADGNDEWRRATV